jgi:LysR substrate binding domain
LASQGEFIAKPKSSVAGRVRFTVGYSSLVTMLARSTLAAAARAVDPLIELELRPIPFDEHFERLASGEVDMLVRWLCTVPRGEYRLAPLASMPLNSFLREDHPLNSCDRLSIRCFSRVPIALPLQEQHYCLHRDLDAHFHMAGAQMHVTSESRSASELIDRVRTDGVVTFLPSYPIYLPPGVISKKLCLPGFPNMTLVAVATQGCGELAEAIMRYVRSKCHAMANDQCWTTTLLVKAKSVLAQLSARGRQAIMQCHLRFHISDFAGVDRLVVHIGQWE